MDGVSGIGAVGGSGYMSRPSDAQAVDGSLASKQSAVSASASKADMTSISATSIQSQTEIIAGTIPAANNNELLGAVLLLLMLEYMQSESSKEKENLLGMMAMLVQQQQQSKQGESFLYMSSSQSYESIQVVSTSSALSAYEAALDPGKVPTTDATGGGSVDTVA
jgi:hypothetical protein